MVKNCKSKLIEGAKHLFDWSVLHVEKPQPQYKEYSDAGKFLLGYRVFVTYKHHGVKEYFFACEEEKLGLASAQKALDRANKFYEKYVNIKEGNNMNWSKIAQSFKHKMNCLFNDRILSVEIPYGNAKSLSNVHSWTVVVNYKYKGREAINFATDDERYLTTHGSARQAAWDTYNLYHKAMLRQQKFAKLLSKQK